MKSPLKAPPKKKKEREKGRKERTRERKKENLPTIVRAVQKPYNPQMKKFLLE